MACLSLIFNVQEQRSWKRLAKIQEITIGEFGGVSDYSAEGHVGISQNISRLFGGWETFEGVSILLDDATTYHFGIYNKSSCCEDWGFLSTEDDLTKFVGSEFISLDRVTTDELPRSEDDWYSDEGGTVFVNVETSLGQIQFTAYNHHNGYYGHSVVLYKNDELVWGETL
jgi:hypothetical protein